MLIRTICRAAFNYGVSLSALDLQRGAFTRGAPHFYIFEGVACERLTVQLRYTTPEEAHIWVIQRLSVHGRSLRILRDGGLVADEKMQISPPDLLSPMDTAKLSGLV